MYGARLNNGWGCSSVFLTAHAERDVGSLSSDWGEVMNRARSTLSQFLTAASNVRKRTLATATALLLCTVVRTGFAAGVDRHYEYRVSWNGIPAASASVQLMDHAAAATTEMRVQIRTNHFVDLFWSLRAESRAEVDSSTLRPLHFEFDRSIDGERELTSVVAEPDGGLTGRYQRPRRYRLIEVEGAGILDPVAAILRALREPPLLGQPQAYEIFTGEARYRVELRRAGADTLTVPAGRFAALRIEPVIWRLETNQPEKRVRRIVLWVTEAEPHVLLRVRSDVFIGAVYCDLTALANVEQRSTAEGASRIEPYAKLE